MIPLHLPSISLAIVLAATPPGSAPDFPALDAARADWVEETLDAMTVREKAAQMVMPWIPGGTITKAAERARIERLVTEHRIGGFIVGRGSAAGTSARLTRLQSLAKVPMLIGADVERGAGMRLVGGTVLAPQMAIGATGDAALAYRQGFATATESRLGGIHLAFAPVADVNINPRNPIINTRAFGSDPAMVARFVREYARGLEDGGMIAVAKHFPGHGDTHTDSHLALPVIEATRARLDSVELVPFRAAVDAGIGGIMTAHIAVPSLSGDRVPATLSREIITGLLRDEMGFDGLIVTDAMNMAALTRVAEGADAVLGAVLAGADILLQPADPVLAIDVLAEAVERGAIRESRLDASVRRILGAKARLGLHEATPRADPAAIARARETGTRLGTGIAERSITLVRDRDALVPMRAPRSAVWIHYAGPGAGSSMSVGQTLRSGGWTVEEFRLRRNSTAAQVAAAERAAARGDRVVILSSSTQAVPWQGTTSLSARFAGLVRRLSASRPVVYVSFGDPYLLASMPHVSSYLLAWSDAEQSQRAAARALLGALPITGRLPIDLPPAHESGFGLVREMAPSR